MFVSVFVYGSQLMLSFVFGTYARRHLYAIYLTLKIGLVILSPAKLSDQAQDYG